MLQMLWPVLLVIVANVFYNICTKSAPQNINPYAMLMVTYFVSAIVTGVLFLCSQSLSSVPEELKKLNWTALALGFSIIGLESGYIFLFRAGWKVSAGSVVCNISLAVVLLFVGYFLYNETISLKQMLGIAVCAAGLYLITL